MIFRSILRALHHPGDISLQAMDILAFSDVMCKPAALSPWHTIGDGTGKFEVKLSEVEGCGASIVSGMFAERSTIGYCLVVS